MRELPELRVLGYQDSRPHLRLLRLPEEVIEPSPVGLNAGTALDRAISRDGWLAFPNGEVWGVPVPLQGRAFLVGGWWDCVAAPDPRTIWLANPVDPDADAGLDPDEPTLLVEYDGVRRRELRRRELPQSVRLEAAVPDGLITRPQDHGPEAPDVLSLWPWEGDRGVELTAGWEVLACRGSLLVVLGRDGEITLLDAATRAETRVRRPLPGGWNHAGSFSPDGARFAIGVEEEHRPPLITEEEIDAYLMSMFDPEAAYEPQLTRLGLIDSATGAATVADGAFDDFATAPVWSGDGRWLVFDAPFDRSSFACDVAERPPRLTPIVRRRSRLSPLVDVTAITA